MNRRELDGECERIKLMIDAEIKRAISQAFLNAGNLAAYGNGTSLNIGIGWLVDDLIKKRVEYLFTPEEIP